MRRFTILAIFAVVLWGLLFNLSYGDVNVGLTVDEDGIKEFHLSIGSHYGIKQVEVEKVRRRSLPDDEVAVVLFISNRAGVLPIMIADLRHSGLSWMDITFKLGLTAEIYYVAFQSDPGPPYGNAYGHYKNSPKGKWGKIKLVDADIINLVNLKVLAETHNYSPEKIVKLRKSGKPFAKINTDLKKARAEKQKRKDESQKAAGGKSESQKGKDKK